VFLCVCDILPNMIYLFVTETGVLFAFLIQLMQLCSENKDDFTNLPENMGLFFQIFDDLIDLLRHEVNSELL
jgi:geranylgeranyl pyrophosphate synthase